MPVILPAETAAALAVPSALPTPTAALMNGGTTPAAPAQSPTRTPIPMPSLKPGEVITWIKIDRPKLPLGEILAGSFALVGLILVVAMTGGVVLGHFKSKRREAEGASGLDLRS